jgi:LysM repeat protein/lysophospholipase L1-like esterase
MRLLILFSLGLFGFGPIFGQDTSTCRLLGIDSTFGYLQYYSPETGEKLKSLFENSDQERVVIFHYGGSHIQAERPTSYARKLLQNSYGNGGRGLIFNYGAANTYSSINYGSTFKGKWDYAKSFQMPPKIPLGVCGMAVKTTEKGAELYFNFKEKIPTESYTIQVFTDVNQNMYDFSITIDGHSHIFNQSNVKKTENSAFIEFSYSGEIQQITLKTLATDTIAKEFRFYGINIQQAENKGIVYHSLGVGAAPFRSVLYLDKLPAQAKTLNPDIVVLDFGTNDILYNNAIDSKLSSQMSKAIRQFRDINPEILIVLTSVQDLYYKGKYITAGPSFRDLVDSMARAENCLYWNWYDLSGGLGTIKTWTKEGYCSSDCIHLTAKGYESKGTWLYKSIENSLQFIQAHPETILSIPGKTYELPKPPVKDTTVQNQNTLQGNGTSQTIKKTTPVAKKPRTYKVKSGDTLSAIAGKYHTTITKIKKANGLKSDMIKIGQVLKIPY